MVRSARLHFVPSQGGAVTRASNTASFLRVCLCASRCGAGTDITTTPCPSECRTCDKRANVACRRHDHGAYAKPGAGHTKLGCDIDNDLRKGTNNWVVQAVYGKWGLAGTWGCEDYGSYWCWSYRKGWRWCGWTRCSWRGCDNNWCGGYLFGKYCYGKHGHYSITRYSGIYKWGYVSPKPQDCPDTDSWLTYREMKCPAGVKQYKEYKDEFPDLYKCK